MVDQSSEIIGDGLGLPVIFKPLIVVHSNGQAENICVIICYTMSQHVIKCQKFLQKFYLILIVTCSNFCEYFLFNFYADGQA